MTHIDLFSGIGGFAIAARWAGFKTVCFVEIDDYAQAIIKQNFGAVADADERAGKRSISQPSERTMAGCHAPRLYGDIRAFDGTRYRGATMLTGGFPCQPFSQAGKRRGAGDDRALWPEMLRVICEARPAWVVGENVAGFVTMELDNCISDLEREGYAVQPLIIPACAVDARHRRDRVWIVAHRDAGLSEQSEQEICTGWDAAGDVGYADGSGFEQRRRAEPVREAQLAAQCAGETLGDSAQGGIRRGQASGDSGQPTQSGEDVADAEGRSERAGLCEGEQTGERGRRLSNSGWAYCDWLPEPDMGRVAHGVPRRVDRLKGLGNAIVPQVAYEILRGIAEIEGGI